MALLSGTAGTRTPGFLLAGPGRHLGSEALLSISLASC